MKTLKLFTSILFLVITILTSCKKETNNDTPTTNVSQVCKVINQQLLTNTDTINISFSYDNDEKLVQELQNPVKGDTVTIMKYNYNSNGKISKFQYLLLRKNGIDTVQNSIRYFEYDNSNKVITILQQHKGGLFLDSLKHGETDSWYSSIKYSYNTQNQTWSYFMEDSMTFDTDGDILSYFVKPDSSSEFQLNIEYEYRNERGVYSSLPFIPMINWPSKKLVKHKFLYAGNGMIVAQYNSYYALDSNRKPFKGITYNFNTPSDSVAFTYTYQCK